MSTEKRKIFDEKISLNFKALKAFIFLIKCQTTDFRKILAIIKKVWYNIFIFGEIHLICNFSIFISMYLYMVEVAKN